LGLVLSKFIKCLLIMASSSMSDRSFQPH